MWALLSSLLVMMVLLLMMQPFTCKRMYGGESDYMDQISFDIIVGQLKQRILRGMNRSEPPLLKATRTHTTDYHIPSPRLVFVPSQTHDFQRPDLMTFRLDSCICSHVLDIEKAFLVFRLRSVQRDMEPDLKSDQPSQVGKKVRNRRLKNKINSQIKERLREKIKRTFTLSGEATPAIAGSNNALGGFLTTENSNATKISSNATDDQTANWSKDKSSVNQTAIIIGGDEILDEARIPSVKIVVRVVIANTGRKRKIAVKELKVKRRTAVIVSVPTRFLRKAALSANHTLSIQVVCRQCSHRVWVESVYKHRRRTRNKQNQIQDKGKLLNPNRPYLYIDVKNSTCTDQSWNIWEQRTYQAVQETTSSTHTDKKEDCKDTSREFQQRRK